jgi:hypothetical protein
MPYFSLLKNIPGIFTQPTGIAAIASLGIHGAIAMIVPLVPVDSSASQETEAPKTVGLVAINPSDLNQQQPNSDPSQQAALQQSQIALQEPELPLKQQIPSSNSSDTSVTLPPLQTPPPEQRPPSSSISQSSSGFTISSLPRSQALPRFNRNSFRADIGPIASKDISSPVIPPKLIAQESGIPETPPINFNKINRESQKDPDLDKTPIKQPSPGLFDPGTAQPTAISLGGSQQKSPFSNNFTFNSPPLTPTAGPENFGSQSAHNLGNQTNQVSDVTRKPETQSQTTKEQLVALNSYNTLREKVQKKYPNIQEQAVIRETIPTDKTVKEASVLGQLIVNPDGKVVDIKFEDELLSTEIRSKVRDFFNVNPPKGVKQLSCYPFQLRFRNDPAGVAKKDSSPITNSGNQAPAPNQSQVPVTIQNQPTPTSEAVDNSHNSLVSTEVAQSIINHLRQMK